MGVWGMPEVPNKAALLLIFLLLLLLPFPALTIRCYTDLEATQVLEPVKDKIFILL